MAPSPGARRSSEPWLRSTLQRALDAVSAGRLPGGAERTELEFEDITLESDPDLVMAEEFDLDDLEVTLAVPRHEPRLSSAPPPPRRSHLASEPTSPYSRPAPPPPAPSSATTTPLGEPPLESWDDTDSWDAPESSSSAPPPRGAYQSSGSTAPFSLTRRPEPYIPRSRSRFGGGSGTHAFSGRTLFTSGAALGLLLAVLGAWSVPRLGERFAKLLERNETTLTTFGMAASSDADSNERAPSSDAMHADVLPNAAARAAARGPEVGAPTPASPLEAPSSNGQTKAGTANGSATVANDVQRVEDLPEVTLEDLLRVPSGSRPSCESQLADWTPSDLGNSRALASQHRRGGQMFLLGGRNDLAEIELCKSIAYEPAGPGAPLLATLYLNQRSPEAAQRVLGRALELEPDADDLRELLGDALSQLGRTTEARSEWLAALHLDGTSDRRVREVSRHWVRTSVAVRRSGDLARAERLLRRSVTLDPNSETAARLLAEAFERQGDTSLAEAWYAHALTL